MDRVLIVDLGKIRSRIALHNILWAIAGMVFMGRNSGTVEGCTWEIKRA